MSGSHAGAIDFQATAVPAEIEAAAALGWKAGKDTKHAAVAGPATGSSFRVIGKIVDRGDVVPIDRLLQSGLLDVVTMAHGLIRNRIGVEAALG